MNKILKCICLTLACAMLLAAFGCGKKAKIAGANATTILSTSETKTVDPTDWWVPATTASSTSSTSTVKYVIPAGKGNKITDDPSSVGNLNNRKDEDPQYNDKQQNTETTVKDSINFPPNIDIIPPKPTTAKPISTTKQTTTKMTIKPTNIPITTVKPTTTTQPTVAPPQNGWYLNGNNTYFYYKGKPVTGWQTMSGVKYFFDSKGVLLSDVGIDVSEYQGNINWMAVKDSGVDFAIIRVGFRGWGQKGNICLDSKFKQNILKANAAGINCGVYFYSQAITSKEAEEEANFVLAAIDGFKLTYPVYFDTEYCDVSEARTNTANLTDKLRTDFAIAYCDTVKKAKYYPGIYASKSWLEDEMQLSRLSSYDTWLAHYTMQTNYKSPFKLWQYTSIGLISGISGYVDRNVGLFDYASYIIENGWNKL